jgi:hypothetical protein
MYMSGATKKAVKEQPEQLETSNTHNGRKLPPVCEVTVVDEKANVGVARKIASSNPDGNSKRRPENHPEGGGL